MKKAEFLKRKAELHETFSDAATEMQRELRFTMRKIQNDPSSPENIEKGRRMDERALREKIGKRTTPNKSKGRTGFPLEVD